MAKQVAWSYSVLTAFETCPWRYYLTKVAKQISEPQTEATMWGNQVHKALEHRLTHRVAALPVEMASFEPLAAKIVASAVGGKLSVENKMCLNTNFNGVSWFAKDAWVRGITDFDIVKKDRAFIGDWKTGKPTPDSAQLKLTAAITFALKPYVNIITNAFIWLKPMDGVLPAPTVEKFTRDDAPGIWQEFAPRVQRLEIACAENKFPKRPSGLCAKWCPVGRANCEHCGT